MADVNATGGTASSSYPSPYPEVNRETADPGSRRVEAQPSLLTSMYEGAVLGDFSETQGAAKASAQILTGLIPFIGQAADLRDTTAAVRDVADGREGGWGNLFFAGLAWVPLAGDFAKSVRKVGLRSTLDEIGGFFRGIKESWSDLGRAAEERAGSFKGLFYQPATTFDIDDLGPGTLGVTNRFGDIEVAADLTAAETRRVLDHEKVHSFLSPKLKPGQDVRGQLGIWGYANSDLLRYIEEAAAETYAAVRDKGLKGLAEGLRFPLENGYVTPERLKIEAKAALGVAGTGLAAIERAASQEGELHVQSAQP